jgi:hypothetical protein
LRRRHYEATQDAPSQRRSTPPSTC